MLIFPPWRKKWAASLKTAIISSESYFLSLDIFNIYILVSNAAFQGPWLYVIVKMNDTKSECSRDPETVAPWIPWEIKEFRAMG